MRPIGDADYRFRATHDDRDDVAPRAAHPDGARPLTDARGQDALGALMTAGKPHYPAARRGQRLGGDGSHGAKGHPTP